MLNAIILGFLRLFIQLTTICAVGKVGAVYGCGWQVLVGAVVALAIDFVVWRIMNIAIEDEKEESKNN